MRNQLLAASPWACLVVLITMSRWLPNRTVFDDRTEQRKVEIAGTMNDVPYIIGRWAGRDVDVPHEAQELLRPNAIFSRAYRQPDLPQIHLLIVHCGDARDMIGHYPPVCYPASGYIAEPVPGPTTGELRFDGRTLPYRLYRFRRLGEGGREERMRIFSAFVLPDGTVTTKIDDINRQSERLAVSIQGVAQVQLLTPAGVSLDEASAAAESLLSGMDALFDALNLRRESEL